MGEWISTFEHVETGGLHAGVLGCTLCVLFLMLCSTRSSSQTDCPIVIQGIDARCIVSTRPNGMRFNPPYHVDSPAGYHFRVNFTIRIQNISGWRDSLFAVVGSLPDGDTFRATVLRQDLSRTDADLYWFTLEVHTKKLGWADFIVLPATANTKTDLSGETAGRNRRSVNLQCPESEDSGE